MNRILIIDTLYPDFIKTLPSVTSYDGGLNEVITRRFGTSDFYSRNLRSLGWDTVDIIANHDELQHQWALEHSASMDDILHSQIQHYNPDVVLLQDLSVSLYGIPKTFLLAAQCSCRTPRQIPKVDVMFTSFPHFIDMFKRAGIDNVVYNPLAFDPIVLSELDTNQKRDIDVSFVGGVGAHWTRGLELLELIAQTVPTFQWWGYGADLLPKCALRDKYQGEAWGLDMYNIMLRSKIAVNRHGEIANGFANNMRMFEATGCGAMLLTEQTTNLHELFDDHDVVGYDHAASALGLIWMMLSNEFLLNDIANSGRQRTLSHHTYQQRMKTVSDSLQEVLCKV